MKKIKFIIFLKRILSILILATLFLIPDITTKYWAQSRLKNNSAIVVIDGFWKFVYTENHDIGFSAFTWLDKYISIKTKRILILLIQISALLFFSVLFVNNDFKKYYIPYSLIIAGALGNIIDRLYRGYVIDFILWYYKKYFWPVFNVADITIVTGFLLLILLTILNKRKQTQK